MADLLLFIRALVVTVGIEAAVTGALRAKFNQWFQIKTGPGRLIALTVFASCLTLPYVWFIFPEIFKDRLTYAIISEIFAWVVETVFYQASLKMTFPKALALSFLANGVSFLVGLLVLS